MVFGGVWHSSLALEMRLRLRVGCDARMVRELGNKQGDGFCILLTAFVLCCLCKGFIPSLPQRIPPSSLVMQKCRHFIKKGKKEKEMDAGRNAGRKRHKNVRQWAKYAMLWEVKSERERESMTRKRHTAISSYVLWSVNMTHSS